MKKKFGHSEQKKYTQRTIVDHKKGAMKSKPNNRQAEGNVNSYFKGAKDIYHLL